MDDLLLNGLHEKVMICYFKDVIELEIREILSSISYYHLDKTNQDTRYDIDQNQATFVNGGSLRIRKLSLWSCYGVDMALF